MSVLKIGDVALTLTGQGNFSGVVTDSSLSGNGMPESPLGVTAGPGLPASASGNFYPMTGNPSGFLTGVPDGYATTAYVESSVSGKLDASAFDSSNYTGIHIDDTMSSYYSGDSAFMGVRQGVFIPGSSSGDFYPASNPSGFLTGVASSYATTSYVDSSVSGKLDKTAQVVTSIGYGHRSGDTYVSLLNGEALSANIALEAYSSQKAASAWWASAATAAEIFKYTTGINTAYDTASAYISSLSSQISSMSAQLPSEISSQVTAQITALGAGAYTSPSGTVLVDTGNRYLEATNSAIRITEVVNPGQTSNVTGKKISETNTSRSSNSAWGFAFSLGTAVFPTLTGSAMLSFPTINSSYLYSDQVLSLTFESGIVTYQMSGYTSDNARGLVESGSASFGNKISALSSFSMPVYTGNRVPDSIYVSAFWTLPPNPNNPTNLFVTGSASIDYVSAQSTSYVSSVDRLVWESDVSAYQSLTAWATAQGWTP